jgi:hypothetical protein
MWVRLCPWEYGGDKYLPDNFLIMLRSDKMTPYTSFASSSNVRAFDFGVSSVACVRVKDGSSAVATTNPEFEERVFRGLLKVEKFAAEVSASCGATARDTALRMPPSTAGLGRLVRCQS